MVWDPVNLEIASLLHRADNWYKLNILFQPSHLPANPGNSMYSLENTHIWKAVPHSLNAYSWDMCGLHTIQGRLLVLWVQFIFPPCSPCCSSLFHDCNLYIHLSLSSSALLFQTIKVSVALFYFFYRGSKVWNEMNKMYTPILKRNPCHYGRRERKIVSI